MSLRSTPSGVPQPKREVSEEGTEKQREKEFTPEKYDARLGAAVPTMTSSSFASGLGDVRTISAYLKLNIGTTKWEQQQQVFWHGQVLSELRTTQAEVTAMEGGAFATPGRNG